MNNKMTKSNNKALHITLWVMQVLLAIIFIMAGVTKSFQPIDAIAESLPWVLSTPVALVRFIGISEILGGLGLLLPSILRIKPILTAWAAIGLAVIMIFAAIFHGARAEYSGIIANMVFMAVALFIAWGRAKKAIIQAK